MSISDLTIFVFVSFEAKAELDLLSIFEAEAEVNCRSPRPETVFNLLSISEAEAVFNLL
jgi:hypothetical protein